MRAERSLRVALRAALAGADAAAAEGAPAGAPAAVAGPAAVAEAEREPTCGWGEALPALLDFTLANRALLRQREEEREKEKTGVRHMEDMEGT